MDDGFPMPTIKATQRGIETNHKSGLEFIVFKLPCCFRIPRLILPLFVVLLIVLGRYFSFSVHFILPEIVRTYSSYLADDKVSVGKPLAISAFIASSIRLNSSVVALTI